MSKKIDALLEGGTLFHKTDELYVRASLSYRGTYVQVVMEISRVGNGEVQTSTKRIRARGKAEVEKVIRSVEKDLRLWKEG